MRWLRLGLQVVGALALTAGAIVGSLIYRQTTEHVDAAGNRDALFVLNSGDIKTGQKIEVIVEMIAREAAPRAIAAPRPWS